MDFAEMFRVLRRRWVIAVPALLLTLIATVGMYAVYPSTYQSTAEISLVGSQSASTQPGDGDNPYMVSGDLTALSGVLVANLSSTQAIQALAAQGGTASYTAQIPNAAAGPFVLLTVTSKSIPEINSTMSILLNFTEARLIQLQEDTYIKTPAAGLVRASVIQPPSKPTKVLKKKAELVAGIFILGLLLTFLLSFAAEAWARNRGRQQEGSHRYDMTGYRGSERPVITERGYTPARRREIEPDWTEIEAERAGAKPVQRGGDRPAVAEREYSSRQWETTPDIPEIASEKQGAKPVQGPVQSSVRPTAAEPGYSSRRLEIKPERLEIESERDVDTDRLDKLDPERLEAEAERTAAKTGADQQRLG